MKSNGYVSVHNLIELHDAIFYEMRFSSTVRPKDLISNTSQVPNSKKKTYDIAELEKPEIRGSKRGRIAKDFGSDFQVFLVELLGDGIGS